MSKVHVFTEKDYKGDKVTLDVGDYLAERNIIGISKNKEFEFPVKYFQERAIKSLIIGPGLNVNVYESTERGGRYIQFENASDEEMKIPDLSTSQYNFADKIIRIVAEKVDVKNENKTQKTTVVDSQEVEKFEQKEFNFNLVIIVLFIALVMMYFINGGIIGKCWFERNMERLII